MMASHDTPPAPAVPRQHWWKKSHHVWFFEGHFLVLVLQTLTRSWLLVENLSMHLGLLSVTAFRSDSRSRARGKNDGFTEETEAGRCPKCRTCGVYIRNAADLCRCRHCGGPLCMECFWFEAPGGLCFPCWMSGVDREDLPGPSESPVTGHSRNLLEGLQEPRGPRDH